MGPKEGAQPSPSGEEQQKCDPLDFVPASGMIVWCRVPEERQPQFFPPPGPKHRPAFVQSIYKAEKPGEPDVIVVVPGTSQPSSTGATYAWDFTFDQGHKDFSRSGLETTTRFKTNNIVAIPLTAEYFDECAVDYLKSTAGTIVRKHNALMGYADSIKGIIEKAFGEWTKEIRRRKARSASRT